KLIEPISGVSHSGLLMLPETLIGALNESGVICIEPQAREVQKVSTQTIADAVAFAVTVVVPLISPKKQFLSLHWSCRLPPLPLNEKSPSIFAPTSKSMSTIPKPRSNSLVIVGGPKMVMPLTFAFRLAETLTSLMPSVITPFDFSQQSLTLPSIAPFTSSRCIASSPGILCSAASIFSMSCGGTLAFSLTVIAFSSKSIFFPLHQPPLHLSCPC